LSNIPINVKNVCIDELEINAYSCYLSITLNKKKYNLMSHYKYTEREILSIMNFAGFTKEEAIDYLDDLIEMDNKIKYVREQESRALEQLFGQ